jgi:hypothetical protein
MDGNKDTQHPKSGGAYTDTAPERPTLLIDFNGNGVADYEEPWFWSGLWGVVSWAVKTFAKPKTLAYRGVIAAENYRAAVLAAQKAGNP